MAKGMKNSPSELHNIKPHIEEWATNMQKCSKWKPETDNKTLPKRLPPIGEQQKEIQYSGWHKDTTGKGLWSEEDDKVS